VIWDGGAILFCGCGVFGERDGGGVEERLFTIGKSPRSKRAWLLTAHPLLFLCTMFLNLRTFHYQCLLRSSKSGPARSCICVTQNTPPSRARVGSLHLCDQYSTSQSFK
jgi:hypothetical protein